MALFTQALPKAAPVAKAPVAAKPLIVAPAKVATPLSARIAPAPTVLTHLQNNAPTPRAGDVRSRGVDSGNASTTKVVTEQWNGSSWVPITNEQAIAASGGNKGQGLGTSTTSATAATLTPQLINEFLQVAGLQGDATKGTAQAAIDNASPAVKAAWEEFSGSGGKKTDAILNYLIDQEIQKQTAAIPGYGSLAQAPYKTFTPFSEQAPEFTPFNVEAFKESPDYQFRLAEGQKAIDRAGSARGNFYSGGALKEAARFGSDLASGEFGNAYDRYMKNYGTKAAAFSDKYNRYNTDFGLGYAQAKGDSDSLYSRFAGLANSGQGATNTGVAANANQADLMSSIYSGMGNANAAAGVAKANAATGAAGQIIGNSLYDRLYGKKP